MAGVGMFPEAGFDEALIESNFRRLLSAVESEREVIRSTWTQLGQERDAATKELERLRVDTEDWCNRERRNIEAEWKRLDGAAAKTAVLEPAEQHTGTLEINCCNELFSLPKSALCAVAGSHLNHMFSDAFINTIPLDSKGRFLLDFNPICFGLVVKYLLDCHKLREKHADEETPGAAGSGAAAVRWLAEAEAKVPAIPADQRQNMDILAEALRLGPFLRRNQVAQIHGTSLVVSGNTVRAAHEGWQMLAAESPLPLSGVSYFEVTVLANPEPRGGLAVGVCNHVPRDSEIHLLRVPGAILYNSNNGLVGDAFGAQDVTKGVQLLEGSVLGVKYDVASQVLFWYHNRAPLGSCRIKTELVEGMQTLYPLFGLYVPQQRISVEFDVVAPSGVKA